MSERTEYGTWFIGLISVRMNQVMVLFCSLLELEYDDVSVRPTIMVLFIFSDIVFSKPW